MSSLSDIAAAANGAINDSTDGGASATNDAAALLLQPSGAESLNSQQPKNRPRSVQASAAKLLGGRDLAGERLFAVFGHSTPRRPSFGRRGC